MYLTASPARIGPIEINVVADDKGKREFLFRDDRDTDNGGSGTSVFYLRWGHRAGIIPIRG